MPSSQEHYRAYKPKPLTKKDIETVEILFGGLHWRAERVLAALFENLGYKARPLPAATKADLLLGRELADIGQCCPTSFTTGNLASFLRDEGRKIGKENVASRFAYITAGSCGACRFGQYHQSYELALRNLGFEDFRLFLMDQNRMDQGAASGGGLEIGMPLTLGGVWAILCTDVLQSLEYRIRPYEVEPGATQRAVEQSVDHLCEVFRKRPHRGRKWSTLVWHLSTDYFVDALREVKTNFDAIEVDRLEVKPVVKITGEFYLQTVEGEPNYNIHSWLESEGAEVYPASIAVWLDYWMRFYVQNFEEYRDIRAGCSAEIARLAVTGYGKDLLSDILGADLGVVETVAHARSALHVFPDADVICDVGGTDVKIMILRQGTVADFRLNSQCSSGNGAFLQGVAERYGIPLEEYADRAFQAKAMPSLAMGCGVFLQSDIVNQQRKGWSAEEIMASLAAVLPLNVWVYAGQLQNLRAVGRRFVLQGGTHRNLAIVKAQVDFITAKVPDAEILIHPHSGEAGAIGAALCAIDGYDAERPSRFRGFETIETLEFRSTTSEHTICRWCPVNCKRAFIDVRVPGAKGRPWSKVPLGEDWERVISGNSCPKGLVEDVKEMRVVKSEMEEQRRAYPNIGEMVRTHAFRRAWSDERGDPKETEPA